MYKKHLFICCNHRKDGVGPTPGCGRLGGENLIEQLKKLVKEKGLGKEIRVNKAGCLGKCQMGPVMVLYPEGKWFGGDNLEKKGEEIFQNCLIENGDCPDLTFTLQDLLNKIKSEDKNGKVSKN